jgi:hypothetical protein
MAPIQEQRVLRAAITARWLYATASTSGMEVLCPTLSICLKEFSFPRNKIETAHFFLQRTQETNARRSLRADAGRTHQHSAGTGEKQSLARSMCIEQILTALFAADIA